MVITFPAGTIAAGMKIASGFPVSVTATFASGTEATSYSGDPRRRSHGLPALRTSRSTHASSSERNVELASPWRTPPERRNGLLAGISALDQKARPLSLERLAGQPLALAFFYTRCDNPNKCPLTVARLAALRSALDRAGLANQVRLAAATLDPEIDEPDDLSVFARSLGLVPSPQMLLLRIPRADLDRLLADLRVEVAYAANRVSLHGLQLFLFDRRGGYVRDYHSVAWDQAGVVADLARLARE